MWIEIIWSLHNPYANFKCKLTSFLVYTHAQVAFADNLRATVSTRFPTWHSSLHVLNKWLKVVKVESCQEIIDPVRTSDAVNYGGWK